MGGNLKAPVDLAIVFAFYRAPLSCLLVCAYIVGTRASGLYSVFKVQWPCGLYLNWWEAVDRGPGPGSGRFVATRRWYSTTVCRQLSTPFLKVFLKKFAEHAKNP